MIAFSKGSPTIWVGTSAGDVMMASAIRKGVLQT
jgi:hypothetical protein